MDERGLCELASSGRWYDVGAALADIKENKSWQRDSGFFYPVAWTIVQSVRSQCELPRPLLCGLPFCQR